MSKKGSKKTIPNKPRQIEKILDRRIVIKPADKGGATVILNAIDYVEEAKRQLDNEIYYKKIESDLTSEHEQLINQCIDTY